MGTGAEPLEAAPEHGHRLRSTGPEAPTPEIASPAGAPPAGPPVVPVARLVVGHADDPAEADADRVADSALDRLRRVEAAQDEQGGQGGQGEQGADAHRHGPG